MSTAAATPEGGDLTEIIESEVARLDGVRGPANGTPFLLMKSLDGTGEAVDVDEILAKAAMSTKDINDLPDSDFAYVEPGGKKDDEGKTTPRSKRHYPIHDEAHVRNALSRAAAQIDEGGDGAAIAKKALPKIKAAAKKLGIGDDDEDMKKAVLLGDAVLVEEGPADDYHMTPLFNEDGSVELAGDEAVHNEALNQVISGLKQLQQQEIAEKREDSTRDVDRLNDVLKLVYDWAAGEQFEGQDDLYREAYEAVTKSTIEGRRSVLQSVITNLSKEARMQPETPATPEEPIQKALEAGTVDEAQSSPPPAGSERADAAGAAEAEAGRQERVTTPGEDPAEPAAGAAESPEVEAEKRLQEETTRPGEDPEEPVAKSTEEVVGDLLKAQFGTLIKSDEFGELLKSVLKPAIEETVEAAVKPLEDRLKVVEETPQQGGPLLKGRSGNQHDWLLVRREAPGGESTPEEDDQSLLKALDKIEDPQLRDQVAREFALRSHPAKRAE
jgi:hypothetical protein